MPASRRFLDLPFDAVETRNSTPSELLNNHRMTRANRAHARPLAECGGSDAHFLWAIGRTWTEYPGRGPSALREAIATRRTEAKGLPWGPHNLLHYCIDRFRWFRFCRHHGVALHDVRFMKDSPKHSPFDEPVWLGIDLGTQSVRVVAISATGEVAGTGTAKLTSRRDGARHEQDPDEWWNAVVFASHAAVAGISPAAIRD